VGLEAGCQAGSLGFWECAGPTSGPGEKGSVEAMVWPSQA